MGLSRWLLRDWLDEPVLALNNRTPRAAAADGRSRHKVIDLLKEMENQTARARQRGGDLNPVFWRGDSANLPS